MTKINQQPAAADNSMSQIGVYRGVRMMFSQNTARANRQHLLTYRGVTYIIGVNNVSQSHLSWATQHQLLTYRGVAYVKGKYCHVS